MAFAALLQVAVVFQTLKRRDAGQEAETEADLLMDEQQQHALQKLEAKAKLMDQKAQACQQLESATKGVSEEMTEWLAANRLQEYAAHMVLIAGACVHRALHRAHVFDSHRSS